jgi:hypothetical protein
MRETFVLDCKANSTTSDVSATVSFRFKVEVEEIEHPFKPGGLAFWVLVGVIALMVILLAVVIAIYKWTFVQKVITLYLMG